MKITYTYIDKGAKGAPNPPRRVPLSIESKLKDALEKPEVGLGK